ncbi:hypothetical protein [Pseudomonas sp. UMAB-40]|uniref:hypothetical protein n=1 Tax=Pseudomonas sp. UMAB-40 TaxID=1365407 RepID=UPI001C5951ED|nr:hypothetical protein [Pseudomonas sp. UMAB-40]
MKHFNIKTVVLLSLFALGSTAHAADSLIPPPPPLTPKDLKKDQADSCNSNLCLGLYGKDLEECAGPLKQLNDLKKKKRPAYLAKCPKD